MTNSPRNFRVALTALLLTFVCTANATLIDRGGGLMYDDVLDITRLPEATLGGGLDWYDAIAWVENLC